MSTIPNVVNKMVECMSIDDFKRWKVDVLCKYCQQRGLVIASSKHKEELVALAFAAYSQNMPVVPTKEEQKSEPKQQYTDFLTLDDGTAILDPLSIPSTEWLLETDGVQYWPPCMICNISDYLVERNERPLYSRLRNDYKEGVYSEFVIACSTLLHTIY